MQKWLEGKKLDGQGTFSNMFNSMNPKVTMETKMSLTMKDSQAGNAMGMISTDRGQPKADLVQSGFIDMSKPVHLSEEEFDFGEDGVYVAPLGKSTVNVQRSNLTESTTSLVSKSPTKKRSNALGLPTRTVRPKSRVEIGEDVIPKSGMGSEDQVNVANIEDEKLGKVRN